MSDDIFEDMLNKTDWKKGMNEDSRETEITPKIGTEAFQIIREKNDDGIVVPKIIKTIISTIYHDGTIRLMNQDRQAPIYYDKRIAIEAFKKESEAITCEYTDRLKNSEGITKKITDEAVELLINESSFEGMENNSWDSMFFNMFDEKDNRKVTETIEIPTPEFEVGQTVYFILEPSMSTMYGNHPKNTYEIVTTTIDKVELFIRNNKAEIRYDFDTAYRIQNEEIFATLVEAQRKRQEILRELVQFYEGLKGSDTSKPEKALTDNEHHEETFEQYKDLIKD